MKVYHSNVIGLAYESRGSFIQQNVSPGSLLTLQAEPTNSYDRDAVAVSYGHHKIGYVPARSRWILQRLLAGEIEEVVAGILEFDEFGQAAVLPIEIRTGEALPARSRLNVSPGSTVTFEGNSRPMETNFPTDVTVSPVIFRARPIGFIVAIILIPVLLGIIILFLWWLESKTTTLQITRNTVRYETGIFNKDRREVGRSKIRTVRVQQSFLNRILNVGSIEIYSAGDKPEIIANDMLEPNRLRHILNEA